MSITGGVSKRWISTVQPYYTNKLQFALRRKSLRLQELRSSLTRAQDRLVPSARTSLAVAGRQRLGDVVNGCVCYDTQENAYLGL